MTNPFARIVIGSAASALVWNLGALECLAHPDHAVQIVSSGSVLHYFVQPEHALTLAVFAVAMWWLSRAVKTQLADRVTVKKVVQVEDRRLG